MDEDKITISLFHILYSFMVDKKQMPLYSHTETFYKQNQNK